MKAAGFGHVAPSIVAAALDALAGSEDGRILAGGQSLMPMLALWRRPSSSSISAGLLRCAASNSRASVR